MLAETEYVTVPLPLPLLPDVIDIQLTLSVAVQLQVLADEVTLILNPPPPDGTVRFCGEME